MSDAHTLLTDGLDFAREGFGAVNVVLGLIIAVVAAFMMRAFQQVFVIAAGATIATVLIELLIPVVVESGEFRLPDVLQGPFWHEMAVLYVGYLIVISIIFAMRKMLLKPAH